MKQHNLKNRNDKIKFLKDLKAGRTTVSEILPITIELWHIEDCGETLVRIKTGERLTKKEYNARVQKEGITTIRIPPASKINEDHEGNVRENRQEFF